MSELDTSGGFGRGELPNWTGTGGGFGASTMADGSEPAKRTRQTGKHAQGLGNPANERASDDQRVEADGPPVRASARSSETESASNQ